MVRVALCMSWLSILLLVGCGWVDSTGRQTNTAPVVALDSMLFNESSTIEIDLSDADADGNITVIEFAELESGSSLAGYCEAQFSDMAVFSPTDYAADVASACGAGAQNCEFVFAEAEAGSGVYVANIPVLQNPTALKYRLTLADSDAASSEDEFTVCLRSLSEPPVAAADQFEVEYLTERVIAGAVFDDDCGFSVRDGVMVNDSDDFDVLEAGLADSGCLDVELVDPPQFHDGVFSLSSLGGFSYQPLANAVAGVTDSFSYRLNDGLNTSDTVTVTLNIVEQGSNTAPVAVNPSVELPEDSVIDLAVDALATDVDGQTLQLQAVGNESVPANGDVVFDAVSLRYTPDPNFFGLDSIPYVVRDAAGATVAGSVSIDVAPVNDPPAIDVIGSGDLSFDEFGTSQRVFVDVSDVETLLSGLQLSVQSADSTVASATVSLATGATPQGNVQVDVLSVGEGDTEVQLSASDGVATSTETLTVSVSGPNAPPVANPANTTMELGETRTINVVNFGLVTDPDGDPITLEAAGLAPGSLDTSGVVQTLGNARIRYTPGAAGTHVINYTVSDGIDTASSTWTVTVTTPPAPNTPPVATNTGTGVAAVGEEFRYDVVVTGSASDADAGDTLSLISASLSAGSADALGSVAVEGLEIVYQPGAAGVQVIEFEVSDGTDSASGAVTVNVIVTAPETNAAGGTGSGNTLSQRYKMTNSIPGSDAIAVSAVTTATLEVQATPQAQALTHEPTETSFLEAGMGVLLAVVVAWAAIMRRSNAGD